MSTGRVVIAFDKESLENLILMMRKVADCDGPDVQSETAEESLGELLRLVNLINERFKVGQLFKINSSFFSAEGAEKTLAVFEPTEWLRMHYSALGIGALK